MRSTHFFLIAVSVISFGLAAHAKSVSISSLEFQTAACRDKLICQVISNFVLADHGQGEEATDGSLRLPYQIEGYDPSSGQPPVTATLVIEDEAQSDGSTKMILRIFF